MREYISLENETLKPENNTHYKQNNVFLNKRLTECFKLG